MKNIKLTLLIVSLTFGQLYSQSKNYNSKFNQINTMEILKTQSQIRFPWQKVWLLWR